MPIRKDIRVSSSRTQTIVSDVALYSIFTEKAGTVFAKAILVSQYKARNIYGLLYKFLSCAWTTRAPNLLLG